MKPWQPLSFNTRKGANSNPARAGRDKSDLRFNNILQHIKSSSDLPGELFYLKLFL